MSGLASAATIILDANSQTRFNESMAREFKPIFGRVTGVITAFVGMWLLGSVGVFLVLHDNHQLFLSLGGYDYVTLGQIGGLYLQLFGARLLSLWIAAWVIAMSDVRHPVHTAFWMSLCLELVLIGIRVATWPWSAAAGLDQSIPALAEFLLLVLIVSCTVLNTWIISRIVGRRS
jgi:hypothetical protein